MIPLHITQKQFSVMVKHFVPQYENQGIKSLLLPPTYFNLG
jgi:hypothetical protein